MRIPTLSFTTLLLVSLAGAASAAPVSVQLQAHNQITSGGAFSTLKWKACAPTGSTNPCLSTTNAWTLANAAGSTAVWTWDAATGVLAMTGTFQTTSFISSNANGSPVISDKVVDLVINTTTDTTTAAAYNCVEGTFLSSVGANGCLNVSLGDDFTNQSSAVYNVGGNANCVQRTVGGDDVSTGNPRGLTNAAVAPPCDTVDGAFNFWVVEADDTATGGQLIVRTATAITSPGANFLTFLAVPDAVDDGPFNAPRGVTITLDVLANDANFVDPVTVTVSTPPGKGIAVVTGSPGNKADVRIDYTANPQATGSDIFVYTVTSASGSDSATVTMNHPLVFTANDDTASTPRNSGAIPINVGANDVGFSDPVTIVITSAPNQGGTAIAPAAGPAAAAIVSYTPATTAPGTPNYIETFSYQITDAGSKIDTATVTVTVTGTGSGGVRLQLDAHNQVSAGGVLSTLKWKACAPTGSTNPCLSTTNAWTLANATPSNAVWSWDAVTGILSMTGIFQTTSFISSNANGSPVISDRVVDLVIDTVNDTTTAASYRCVEGTFVASVGANGCLNTSTGGDFTNDSSALYDVGGNARCVQRTVGGDDAIFGNTRGLMTLAAAPPCDPQDGAFDLWNVEVDATASGGQLIVRSATPITNPSANYLTFSVDPDPDPDQDGVVSAQDNCTLVANPLQCDSDGDGYGNRCDGDLTNNGFTNAQDSVVLRSKLGEASTAPAFNVADLNCNGFVNAQDTVLLRQLLGLPPGPSGLSP